MACTNTGISLRLLRGQWVPSREKEEYTSGSLHLTVPLTLSKGFSLLPEKEKPESSDRSLTLLWQSSLVLVPIISSPAQSVPVAGLPVQSSASTMWKTSQSIQEMHNNAHCTLSRVHKLFLHTQLVWAKCRFKLLWAWMQSVYFTYMLGRDHRHPKVCAS